MCNPQLVTSVSHPDSHPALWNHVTFPHPGLVATWASWRRNWKINCNFWTEAEIRFSGNLLCKLKGRWLNSAVWLNAKHGERPSDAPARPLHNQHPTAWRDSQRQLHMNPFFKKKNNQMRSHLLLCLFFSRCALSSLWKRIELAKKRTGSPGRWCVHTETLAANMDVPVDQIGWLCTMF